MSLHSVKIQKNIFLDLSLLAYSKIAKYTEYFPFLFRLHFKNPSFGRHTSEDQDVSPAQALVPGQHQYTNPLESSGSSEVSADITYN
jgi:hypothetical protein